MHTIPLNIRKLYLARYMHVSLQEDEMATLTRAEVLDQLNRLGINRPAERTRLLREYLDYIDCHQNLFTSLDRGIITIVIQKLIHSMKAVMHSRCYQLLSLSLSKIVFNRAHQHSAFTSARPAIYTNRK